MQQQSLQICHQCVDLLTEPAQSFRKVEYLKKLTKISNNQKYRKTSLFLYCLYCVLVKFDYVEALQAIEKSQGVDQGSMLSIGLAKLIRALLYTFIDKHRDALSLMKQGCSLMKSADSISLEMKNHYKRMIPIIIANFNTSNGKKSFYKFFNEIYDELAKQSSNNDLNQEILYSIHSQIQTLKSQIDFIPTVNTSRSQQQNTLQKSLSMTKFNNTKANTLTQPQQDDYMGFAKPLTKEEKSVNNIKKMIESQKMLKESSQKGRSPDLKGSIGGLNRKNATRNFLKNQPNPYQLNLYTDQKPQCEFL